MDPTGGEGSGPGPSTPVHHMGANGVAIGEKSRNRHLPGANQLACRASTGVIAAVSLCRLDSSRSRSASLALLGGHAAAGWFARLTTSGSSAAPTAPSKTSSPRSAPGSLIDARCGAPGRPMR